MWHPKQGVVHISMGVVIPFGCFPSARARPDGSRHDGMCAADKAPVNYVIQCSMTKMATCTFPTVKAMCGKLCDFCTTMLTSVRSA